ncbi:MAG TPA: membrane protein insertion efficiency factor YidD [Pseudolabrys sp.]|nr:membrane protein insertion efficiency factor YidD [Pseudolabrys sp.]
MNNGPTLEPQSNALSRLPRIAGRGLIALYRYTLSPLIGPRCRHLPTCSEYGDEAITRFGLWAGGWMTLARILRCHPWGTHGLDFVPQVLPSDAHWWMPWRYGRWRGTNETAPERATSM